MKLVSTQDKTYRNIIDTRTKQRIWQKIQQRMHMQEDSRTQNKTSLTWVIGLIAVVALVMSLIIYHHLYAKILFMPPLWLHHHFSSAEDFKRTGKHSAISDIYHSIPAPPRCT